MRIALMLEYDGSHFHGWQAQKGLRTVQSVVEKALSHVADHPVNVVCAGRTDTGVHATSQFVHFDTTSERLIRAWIHGGNSFLPKDVCIKWGKDVDDSFHARHSATARRYCYCIYNAPLRPALMRANLTWQYRQLNHELMQEAGQYLIGEHDFTSFRSMECQSKTPMRYVKDLKVTRNDNIITIDIIANAFLHHMVRNIAGVLMAIGSERKPVPWIEDVLLAKDRRLGAETAPPYGLYFVNAQYPKEYGITQRITHPMQMLQI